MVHPLRIGAAIPPYGPTYDDVRRAALAAEAAEADSLWTWDHFFQSGTHEDVAGPNLECMTVLAALAVATRRASLGALVACNSYRNADLHAEDEAALAASYHEVGMTHLIVTLSAPRYDMAPLDRLCAWRDRVAV